MDLVKVAKSAFGAAATGLSLSAALDSIFENVINPGKAGVAAAILAVVFAIKTAVQEKIAQAEAAKKAWDENGEVSIERILMIVLIIIIVVWLGRLLGVI